MRCAFAAASDALATVGPTAPISRELICLAPSQVTGAVGRAAATRSAAVSRWRGAGRRSLGGAPAAAARARRSRLGDAVTLGLTIGGRASGVRGGGSGLAGGGGRQWLGLLAFR